MTNRRSHGRLVVESQLTVVGEECICRHTVRVECKPSV